MNALITLLPTILGALHSGIGSLTGGVKDFAANNPKTANGIAAAGIYSWQDPSYWRATFDMITQLVGLAKNLF